MIICEGEEGDVQDYVSRLQRLRWKLMVVRGEDVVDLGEEGPGRGAGQDPAGDAGGVSVATSTAAAVDAHRVFKDIRFEEMPADCMSEFAGHCKNAGLEALFLTLFKKAA